GFAAGIWQELAEAGVDKRLRLIAVPRAWLGSAGAAEVPWGTLPRVKAKMRTVSGGRIEITLAGWATASLGSSRGTSISQRETLSAVDAWAVQSGWQPGEAFVPQAIAHRGKRSPLPTRLAVPATTRGTILVKVWNGFGLEGTVVLPVPRARQGTGKAK